MTSKKPQNCPACGEVVEDSFMAGWDHVIKKYMSEREGMNVQEVKR